MDNKEALFRGFVEAFRLLLRFSSWLPLVAFWKNDFDLLPGRRVPCDQMAI